MLEILAIIAIIIGIMGIVLTIIGCIYQHNFNKEYNTIVNKLICTRSGHCGRRIEAYNEYQYTCPKCHTQIIIIRDNRYE